MLWTTAQVIGVAVTVALIVGFIAVPDIALAVLWNAAIPLLPASFLISPALWRNVCPLATLNMLPDRIMGRRILTARMIPVAGTLGIALLGILVPARRFLFNTNGIALAVTVIVVAVAALLLGMVFDAKAGFCNSICPVLPVERLYGQHPLVHVGNPRCPPCTLCTNTACIDVAPTRSIALTFGEAGNSHAWLRTSYGVFAAAFPGFVVGYYTTEDVSLTGAGMIYLHVALWATGSYLLTAIVVRTLSLGSTIAVPILAAVAVTLYYWFAAPILATTFGVAGPGTTMIRGAALALVTIWLWRATAPKMQHA